jgi:hypothetical protein
MVDLAKGGVQLAAAARFDGLRNEVDARRIQVTSRSAGYPISADTKASNNIQNPPGENYLAPLGGVAPSSVSPRTMIRGCASGLMGDRMNRLDG